jgi:protein phosphatase
MAKGSIEPAKRLAIAIPRNTLVVLVGVAGCGKSTFASRNFLPNQIVSSDECRALVSDDAANQAISGHAFQLMNFIIQKRLLLGKLTVADATNLTARSRSSLVRMARRFGFCTAAIVFDVPVETCLARNLARKRVVPEEAVRRQQAEFRNLLKPLRAEAFDYLFILNRSSADTAHVEIRRALHRRP